MIRYERRKFSDGIYLECHEMLLEMMIYNLWNLCASKFSFMAVLYFKNLLCLFKLYL